MFPRPRQTHCVILIPGSEGKSSSIRAASFRCFMYDSSIAGTSLGGKSSLTLSMYGAHTFWRCWCRGCVRIMSFIVDEVDVTPTARPIDEFVLGVMM